MFKLTLFLMFLLMLPDRSMAQDLTPDQRRDLAVREGALRFQAGAFAEAVEIWRPLADSGHPGAQLNMGQAYRLGRGVDADMTEATRYYKLSADQGHDEAQRLLAVLALENPNSDARQRATAMELLSRAAAAGNAAAQYRVGLSHCPLPDASTHKHGSDPV